jgi:hypothetical protein
MSGETLQQKIQPYGTNLSTQQKIVFPAGIRQAEPQSVNRTDVHVAAGRDWSTSVLPSPVGPRRSVRPVCMDRCASIHRVH